MGTKRYLFGAASPLALVGSVMMSASIDAAEIKTRTVTAAATPRIKTPNPVKIEDTGRIRTVVTPPEADEPADNSAEQTRQDPVAVQEAQGTSSKRVRVGTPRVDASTPVKVENTPRIKTRIATPVEEEAPEEAKPRIRIGTPRIDTSTPAEIENKPHIRTKVPVPVERDVPSISGGDEEPASPKRVRIGTPRVDTSTPAEVEDTPRVRTRVATPSDDGEEQAPPTRTRIGNPRIDGTVPVTLPGSGSVPSIDSLQANCLFRPAKNLAPIERRPLAPGSSAILELVCMVNGKPSLMGFRFDVPTEKNKIHAIFQAENIYNNKMSLIVTYAIKSVETDSDGRSIYKLLDLKAGPNDRKSASCITPTAAQGSAAQTWCNDGTTIFPMSFLMNDWLQGFTHGVSISASDPNAKPMTATNVSTIIYESATSPSDSGPFLISSSAGGLVPTESAWNCFVDSRMAASWNCAAKPYDMEIETYLSYALPGIAQSSGPMPEPKNCESKTVPVYDDSSWAQNRSGGQLKKFVRYYDYTTTTCDVTRIGYHLSPGTLPPKYRNQMKGACYLASRTGFAVQRKVVKITYSRAVEATDTGEEAWILMVGSDEGRMERVIAEGKTLNTNGSLDPDKVPGMDGKYRDRYKTVSVPCP